uniref:Cation/H+ exchanger transmembrane domain-containing protein n=3 Tax=Ciona intestinalis TaxID=7719 RepID=F6U823_CIOIN
MLVKKVVFFLLVQAILLLTVGTLTVYGEPLPVEKDKETPAAKAEIISNSTNQSNEEPTEANNNQTTPVPPKSDEKKENNVIENIQTGLEAEVQQQNDSMKIFFILLVLAFCILLTHCLIRWNFHFLPESIAVVFLGAAIGGIVKIMQTAGVGNWLAEEMLSPNTFFLMILPPIIFEAGYSLHKGNFFQNFGSILIFAVFGTLVSAMFVGGGMYLMGVAGIAYNLTLTECFAFGSLVSAVDPVATIAIFKALNVDPTLNMLVFGESILNDAVAIVLTNTFQGLKADSELATASGTSIFFMAVGDFLRMMFGSAF